MIRQDTLLVTLVQLVDRLPAAGQAKQRGRGRPTVYSDCLFLKALLTSTEIDKHSRLEA
jgi:hypothetical protein